LPLPDRNGDYPQQHLAMLCSALQANAYAGFKDL
jgi:hypothetical protein